MKLDDIFGKCRNRGDHHHKASTTRLFRGRRAGNDSVFRPTAYYVPKVI